MLTRVPQGSILRPLHFLIYNNDIYNSSEKLSFHLFADDTNLLYADRDNHEVTRKWNQHRIVD